MGWIRVAAHREVEPQTWWNKVTRPRRYQDGDRADGRELGQNERGGAAPAPSTEAAPMAPQSDSRAQMKSTEPQSAKRSLTADGFTHDEAPQAAPGTGWGDRRYDPVQQTTFEPQRWASDQITLRYEYAAGLQALGIFPRQPRVGDRERGEL